MRNVILVHGLWHGSWCWSLVAEHLAARAVPSIAVDLDGHGLNCRSPKSRWARPFDATAFATEPSPVAAVTASSAAAALVAQIRRIGGGEPCVVVAHSMGGIVATLAAELEPTLFSHLVYVTAFAPVSGLPGAAYIAFPENAGETVGPLLRGDLFATGALRLDPADPELSGAVRETFYGDVEPATAQAALALITPDGPAGIAGETFTVTRERYGSVPHTYVVCTQDTAIRPDLQRRFAREIDAVSSTPTTVVEFDSSHSPFMSMPEPLSEVIAALW
ncbi:alpha/beta hydrolase [Kineosporia sp. NBRC 101731]|uniref:alpha/beta fold hydrolase n=1 Tax=Kineosporia sp. NBRC 101731 TaxID=3032199 RepID=UPI0024A011DE|nr:alpha/beta hydrolase [Kineosporia sp. NBRC 101731]GLY30491.1 esterase [Kineosporia sp. NBRC 101731]